MKSLKPIIVIGGLAALVIATYIGFGAANQQNTAHAETKESKWKTGKEVALDTDQAKLGYTVGAQVAGSIQGGGMVGEIDIDAFLAAQREILSGAEPRMSPEEMQQSQQAFQLKQQQKYEAVAQENKTKGEAFLAKTKGEDGIKVTESGLQYEVVREGKGKQPTAESTVTVHYIGSLIDGTPFDSSYKRNQPADFPVSGVIPGFSEGLQLMKEGAKYRFVIPSEIAYGPNGPGIIGPNQVLVFEVELIGVK